jgi:hypothetical protein
MQPGGLRQNTLVAIGESWCDFQRFHECWDKHLTGQLTLGIDGIDHTFLICVRRRNIIRGSEQSLRGGETLQEELGGGGKGREGGND